MLVDFFGIWFGFRVILFGIIIVMCEVLSLGNGNKFNKVFFFGRYYYCCCCMSNRQILLIGMDKSNEVFFIISIRKGKAKPILMILYESTMIFHEKKLITTTRVCLCE